MIFSIEKSLSHVSWHASTKLNRHSGMSLVELMISITIGLMLVAGITTLISHQSSTRAELDKAGQQIENGRYAMQVLKDGIELAGFYGEYYDLGPPDAAFPDPCAKGMAALDAAMPLPIQGYDSPATVPSPLSGCLSNANHLAGTDILVVRRTDTGVVDVATAVANQPYLQAGLDVSAVTINKVLGTGSDTSVFTLKNKAGTAAKLRKYLVQIYYVSPCNIPASGDTCNGTSDDNGKPIPTLKRLDLGVSGGATAFTETPLVEGIQNLQLDYGIDSDGDGAPDYYTTGTYRQDGTTPMTTTDWSNVVTVRVNLLSRNTESSAGHNDSKQYNLGMAGSVGPFNDAYKRHLFNGTVRLVNLSGRRLN